ncbi:MAG: bifunctional aspartate kinase/homoserine dehydrogenase I [Acidobacteria bacterium]|nr:bifunctional aspartate kinase/homoserine dehydrogenase I [Acidobacteriota bacterium]MBP7474804.1 bifunctional aspartate kinase/homoserine dehydrogenase I [Pyrinomonadaceae bacterium]MBP9108380.1 bifunctional aspartate kinase/homoserine dehydrogenase I [Pyrinomonadaceae bacterium]
MKVLKFGGSSVGSAETIEKVIEIVRVASETESCAVVLSAMQGTTDDLIAAGRAAESGDDGYIEILSNISDRHLKAIHELFHDGQTLAITDFVESTIKELSNLFEGVRLVRELSPKTLDRILSFGEIVSTRMVSARMIESGIENEWKDSRLVIRTDSNHCFGAVDFAETNTRVKEYFEASEAKLHIFPGFIASDSGGYTTTLGRGGSDYTAAIIAAAVDADVLEIWTDVSGMMTADPRFVKNVRQIPKITYREAMELSHFGAKVIYPPTIQPVMAKGIPVLIKNTFAPDDVGTLIEAESTSAKDMIRGITSIDKITVLNLEGSGMVGIPGFSKRLFDALSRASINVILITQSSSEHSICVAIEEKFADLAKRAVDREFEYEIAVGRIDPLKVESGFSILALVGDNMKEHTGVSGKMFTTLGQNGININAIAQGSSERNISAIISSRDVRKAVNTLHEEFFSDGSKQINLYIAGVGLVGGKLIGQLLKQHDHVLNDMRLNLRVVGLASSTHAKYEEEGVDLTNYKDQVLAAEEMNIDAFTDAIIENNLRNSIFVDVTANAAVVETYPKLLAKSISIIACNKVAASSEYDKYSHLKDLAREYGTNFFFETNVGAGLPVIHTLGDLLRSGDRVNRIEAVLSGTLNFVFNHYDGSRPFAEVVRQAQDEGYTEPDPRLDLSGTDVARKILILAREAGYKLEMTDIENTGFLPESCLAGSVDDFYAEMAKHEAHFRGLLDDAVSMGLTLKYIASFDNGKAAVGLQSIGPEHNFANLSGKDNAVLFYTDRYSEQPLVIKGAGAGADVTAAGVFADIIRAARS